MRAPRMTTRRWMGAVAVVALLIGAARAMDRRSKRFARLATSHAHVAMEHLSTLMDFGGDPPPLEEIEKLPPAVQGPARYLHRAKSLVLYHRALKDKYDRAARYPWLPVEPDPLEPKL
jgi:hypothetical protein